MREMIIPEMKEEYTMNDFNIRSNVISEEEFRRRVEFVFRDVAKALSRTLGPFGKTSMLEKGGDMHITKDGWQVLKRYAYEDPILSNILSLLVKIASQVVVRVGDGTTTSIVSANQLLEHISSVDKIDEIRSKDFLDSLNRLVDYICKIIQQNAIQIDKDGDLSEIFDLAMVSTNGEVDIANMIQTIYKETSNPTIEFTKSKSNLTTYEIVDGYKMQFMEYIDRIFINNDDGTADIKNPFVLMFDHKIEADYYEKIIMPVLGYVSAQEGDRQVVVIAPYYDTYLLQKFRRLLNTEYKATHRTTAVYVRASLMNNHFHDLYQDFGALLGCNIINESIAYDIVNGELEFCPDEYLGTVKQMVIGEHSTYARGFCNTNEGLLKLLTDDANAKYKEATTNSEMGSLISEDAINAKQRVAKLKCKMGTIKVGGVTELAKQANYDLVEDAIKACESSYLHGYVPGQTIAIQTAIEELRKSEPSETMSLLLDAISEAFVGVTRVLLNNKFITKANPEGISKEQVREIVKHCVENQEVVDVINSEIDNIVFTQAVCNSCKTDIEILRATAGIIGLLLSSNQYIAIRGV